MASNKGGRRPIYTDRQMIWGYLSGTTHEQVVRLAEERGVSKSRLIAAFVEYALANIDSSQLPTSKQTEQEELPMVRAS
jgi:hypothetical protein